jgi:hypothetical protein
MAKLVSDKLVDETSQALYGLSALIELMYQSNTEVELRAHDTLRQRAQLGNWEAGDLEVEEGFLDISFKYWLPKLAAYSVLVLLYSIVETQLVAYSRRFGQSKASVFDPNDLKGSVLDRVRLYVKKVAGLDLSENKRWQSLKDLQDLRDIVVHRAGKPGDKIAQVEQMIKRYPGKGISLDKNPFMLVSDVELGVSIHTCRYLAGQVEAFFTDLLQDADLPVKTGMRPNIESGLV